MGLFLDFTSEEITQNLTSIGEFERFMSVETTFSRGQAKPTSEIISRNIFTENSASIKINSLGKKSNSYIKGKDK